MIKIERYKVGRLEFGIGRNGMYWSYLKDELGNVIRARTGFTLREVLEGMEDKKRREVR